MSRYLFSTIDVSRQVFYHSTQTFAIVNLKPILPGHVLVIPQRVVPRLKDLAPGELADLMHFVQRVGSVIERVYKADGLTIACQDGVAAGQTVPHVHFHLLPRKISGDPFAGQNDQIYPALEQAEQALPKNLMANKTDSQERLDKKTEPIKVDADEDRKPRTLDDMEKEATWLKEVFAKDEDDARNR